MPQPDPRPLPPLPRAWSEPRKKLTGLDGSGFWFSERGSDFVELDNGVPHWSDKLDPAIREAVLDHLRALARATDNREG